MVRSGSSRGAACDRCDDTPTLQRHIGRWARPQSRAFAVARPFILLALISLMGLTVLAGCFSAAPYVNIPGQPGDSFARKDPNSRNVRDVLAVALRDLQSRYPLEGRVLLELPEGTNELTYADVVSRVENGLIAPFDGGEASTVVQVTSVRLRGFRGSVDVIRPGRTGVRQLVTIDLQYDAAKGWSTTDTRFLNAPINDETLYVPYTEVD